MDEREVGSVERELTRRLESDLARVPVRPLETYLAGAQRAARARRLFSVLATVVATTVVILAAIGAGRVLSDLRDQGPAAFSPVPTPVLPPATPVTDLGGPAICSTGLTIADRFSPPTVAAMSAFDQIAVIDVKTIGDARWNTPDGRWDPSSTSSERNWIYRPLNAAITRVVKGVGAGVSSNPLFRPLRLLGGTVGCHSFSVMPSPSIEAGSSYVVFLSPGANASLGFAVMEAWPVRDGLVTTPTEGEIPLAALVSIFDPAHASDSTPDTGPFPARTSADALRGVLGHPFYASVIRLMVVGPDPDPRVAGLRIPRAGTPVYVRSLSAGKESEWIVPIEYGGQVLEILAVSIDATGNGRICCGVGWEGSFPRTSEADARAKASVPNDPVATAEIVWADFRATSSNLSPFWRLVRRSGAEFYLFDRADRPVPASEYPIN